MQTEQVASWYDIMDDDDFQKLLKNNYTKRPWNFYFSAFCGVIYYSLLQQAARNYINLVIIPFCLSPLMLHKLSYFYYKRPTEQQKCVESFLCWSVKCKVL